MCTAVCLDFSSATTLSAWPRTGPVRASSRTSAVTFRKRVIRPVGGASITTAS